MARMRPPSSAKLALLAAIVAVLSTLAFAHDVAKHSWTTSSPPSAGADATSSPIGRRASSPTGPDASDDRGFLNSSARCEGSLTAVAMARTQASLVTICSDLKGGYTYRGVRLSDGAALNVSAESTGGREFVARSDGVTYSLSTQQLVITAGDTLVRREPVIEYREPYSFPAQAPPGQTSASPAPSSQRPVG
jgi:hypothetical protein